MGDYSHRNPAEEEKRIVRRTQAMEMKAEGATYEQIAEALGYSGKGHAYKDMQKRLQEVRAEEALATEEYRTLHSTRLERLLQAWWPQATGQDVNRPGLNPKAAEIVLRVLERQSKLHGLDAPIKTEVTMAQNVDERIEELLRLLAEQPEQITIEGEVIHEEEEPEE